MTPADLPRLSGQLHHLPDARNLRLLGADGVPQELPWQAVEVYEAAPMVLGLAPRSTSSPTQAVNDAGAGDGDGDDALGEPFPLPRFDDYTRMPPEPDYLAVACPRCRAVAGTPCDSRTLGKHSEHRDRVEAAYALRRGGR